MLTAQVQGDRVEGRADRRGVAVTRGQIARAGQTLGQTANGAGDQRQVFCDLGRGLAALKAALDDAANR